MNRVVKRITTAVCILLMVFAVVEIFSIFNNSVSIKQYAEETNRVEDNEVLFNKLEQLEIYAQDYKDANPSVDATTTELSLQFIRNGSTYTGSSWNILLGDIDQNFVDYIVNEKDSEFKFDENDKLYDIQTGKEIDFIHLAVVLNTYHLRGEEILNVPMIGSVSTHYAGWAGDLLTLLTETVNYRETNSITDTSEITAYVNRKLATNESSSFGSADALADLDALNIYELNTIDSGLTDTLRNYYHSTDEFDNNAYNRFNTVRVKYTAKENLESVAQQLLENSLAANFILKDTEKALYLSKNVSDMEIISKEFSEYVFGKVYINTSVDNIDLKVGETEQIDINEKNILEPDALRFDSDKVAVSVKNFKMNVKALKYGTFTIDIYNGEDKLKTINVNVKNVEPEVASQPTVKEEYKVGESVEITFEANGTNNKYRWYIYDSEKGTDTFLKETSEPKINLKLEESYHNKYLKCGIVNEGNTEVFTTPVKLVVKKVTEPTGPEEEEEPTEPNGGENGGTSGIPEQNKDNSSNEGSDKGQNNKPSSNNKGDVSNPNTSPGEDVKLDGTMNSNISKTDDTTKLSNVVLVVFFVSIVATIVFIILAKKNKETW